MLKPIRCVSIRCMRTTISLDEDVLSAVRDRAHQEMRSMGSVLSELARQALTAPQPRTGSDQAESFYGFTPLPRRGAAVSNELVDQLRDGV